MSFAEMEAALQTGVSVPVVRRTLNPPSRRVSIAEIQRRLGITLMTVRQWRLGSPLRRPLRYTTEPKMTRQGPSGQRHNVVIYERDLLEFLTDYRPDLLKTWNTRPSTLTH